MQIASGFFIFIINHLHGKQKKYFAISENLRTFAPDFQQRKPNRRWA